MMQRYWRMWDIHRGVTLTVIVALAVTLMSVILTTGPGLADTVAAPPPTQEWDSRIDYTVDINGTWNSCHQPVEYRTDATGSERELIDDAIDRLADVTGFTFEAGPPLATLPATSDAGLLIGFTDGTHPLFDSDQSAVGMARTLTRNGHITGSVVGVRTDVQLTAGFGSGASQGNVLLHELGHAMGLPHTSNPESLMYPQANDRQGDGYAPEDIQAIQAATQMPVTCP